MILWSEFTPIQSLLGGVIIGVAVTLFLFSNRRIAGISGIVSGALKKGGAESWRLAFIIGLMVSPFIMMLLPNTSWLALPDSAAVTPSIGYVLAMIVGGFLVGLGARLSNGCTSGHGVCGLARLSPRSAAAVCTFMVTGVATVFVVKHLM